MDFSAPKRRQHGPVHVHETNHKDQHGNDKQRARLSLHISEEQEKEGEEETKNDEQQRDVAPDTFEAADVPGNFLAEISAPDDEPLRKFQVGPQHDERQEEA